MVQRRRSEVEWTLSIPPEKVCDFILRVRELQAKDVVPSPESGSNPTDDGMREVLEDTPDDAVESELGEFVLGLNEDQQIDLVALMWLGRGDEAIEGWTGFRAEAARVHNARTKSYLLSLPLLADYLEEGLSQFGQTCGD